LANNISFSLLARWIYSHSRRPASTAVAGANAIRPRFREAFGRPSAVSTGVPAVRPGPWYPGFIAICDAMSTNKL